MINSNNCQKKLLYIHIAIMIYNPCNHPSASPRLRMIVIIHESDYLRRSSNGTMADGREAG